MPSTLKLIDAGAFARMKKGAIFISTARGGIHDEAALVQALQSGHLAGAGLDVWDQEPPPLDHPLLKMDNVYRHLPHRGRDARGASQRGRASRPSRSPACWPASGRRAW